MHGLTAAKQIMEGHHPLEPGPFFANKTYIDAAWSDSLKEDHCRQPKRIETIFKFLANKMIV